MFQLLYIILTTYWIISVSHSNYKILLNLNWKGHNEAINKISDVRVQYIKVRYWKLTNILFWLMATPSSVFVDHKRLYKTAINYQNLSLRMEYGQQQQQQQCRYRFSINNIPVIHYAIEILITAYPLDRKLKYRTCGGKTHCAMFLDIF